MVALKNIPIILLYIFILGQVQAAEPKAKVDVQVEGEGLSERVLEVLARRLDPNNIRNLVWRPADSNEVRPARLIEEPVRVRWIYNLSPDGSQVELAAVCRPKEDPQSFWDPAGNPIVNETQQRS